MGMEGWILLVGLSWKVPLREKKLVMASVEGRTLWEKKDQQGQCP